MSERANGETRIEQFEALKAEIASLKAEFAKALASRDEAAAMVRADHEAHVKALGGRHAAALEAQRKALEDAHAKAVAELKASVLVPALRDLQARQGADAAEKHRRELADLAAKHAAEMGRLR